MAGVARAALAALCIAVLAAACGSSSTSGTSASTAKVSATSYATSLCNAIGPFEKQVGAARTSLDDVGSVSASKGKAKLIAFLAGLASDSSAAVTKLKAAGIPQVSGGASFAEKILDTFTRLDGTLGRSEKVAQQLSTSSESTFKSGAQELATAVKESVGDIGAGLDKQSNKALDAAAATVGACHSI